MKSKPTCHQLSQGGLGLLAVLCGLSSGPGAQPSQAAVAKDKYDPSQFSELTAPPPTPGGVMVAQAEAPASSTPAPTTPRPAIPPAAPRPATPPAASAPIDANTGAKRLYSFQADNLDLRAALAAFARANNLNIIPDNDVSGTVTLDVRDLPLDEMMRALLEASNCSWVRDGNLIRVHTTETRTFTIDYLRLSRKGIGLSSATLASASAGGMGGFGQGGGGGGGGGGGMGGGMGGASAGTTGGTGGSSVSLIADNPIDFWKELKEEIGFLLTDAGKSSLAINMTAGILQVTDRPLALKRVEDYLSGVDKSVHRQVEIEARLYDVSLNDQFQFGIDWIHVAEAYGGGLGFGQATLPVANGGGALQDSAVGGLNHFGNPGGGNPFALVFTNFNTSAAVNALKQQGNVEVIAKPRIRTLNNQTALIKVGTERPFFSQSFQALQSQSGNQTFSGDQITSVTVGTILSITPQISGDDYVSLDISPVLTSLVDTLISPSKTATAPVLDTKQASTLVRVHDGNTVLLGGLIQSQRSQNDTKIPLLGDIPLLGKLFTGTYRNKQKSELVIFVTPHLVKDGQELPLPPAPAQEFEIGPKKK